MVNIRLVARGDFWMLFFVIIPKPVWAVGFALEQTLRDATLNVFSYVDFKVALAYHCNVKKILPASL
jgi:hypothetical protein